ncbi:MAG: aminoacyl-histidine dipeptidase [Clostridia bacterium]|nr:aminoacyl-histidine dipeptidase [Clostridia bacterium]
MNVLSTLTPCEVFRYFEEISAVPRGSGYREKIADYCENFAKEKGLSVYRDSANNVVIFKEASKGYENAEPIIIQGHLDMVWQKDTDCTKDLEREGIDLYIDGDFIRAKGTTLGADNGIAVAMAMAILADDTLSHPKIEAVFTTDEEVGMLGAKELDVNVLSAKKMLNVDSEEPGVITVSCAGGSDFTMTIPYNRQVAMGEKVIISLKGLKGGHSGIEIDSGRVNANILAGRILGHLSNKFDFDIALINGGNRANAIANLCQIVLVTEDSKELAESAKEYTNAIKTEIFAKEENFSAEIEVLEKDEYEVLGKSEKDKLIYALSLAPNGVQEMSAEIENLVETSLNLGILETKEDEISMTFALRSSKKTALFALCEKLGIFAKCLGLNSQTSGFYPPWEFKRDSKMQDLCSGVYEEMFGAKPKIEAIHAGLECAVFAGAIDGLDCISIGPRVLDAHTTKERLSISSTKEVYDLIINILRNCD